MNRNTTGFKRFLYDIKTFFPLLINLTSKDFKLKYRRSVLGVLWSILNPLLMMIVLTQVFGILLKATVDNFATYYIVGWSLWNFFAESTSLSMSSILAGAPLIKKVYLPKYIFPLEKCLFAMLNFLFTLIAVIAVMLIQGVVPTWTILLAPVPVLYCFVFSVGFSLILSALTVYFRDIQHLYSVLLTIWMYLTPIIYPISIMESNPTAMSLIRCNPLYHYVEQFRGLMMYGALPTWTDHLLGIGMALASFALGCLVFSKAQKKFILHI